MAWEARETSEAFEYEHGLLIRYLFPVLSQYPTSVQTMLNGHKLSDQCEQTQLMLVTFWMLLDNR